MRRFESSAPASASLSIGERNRYVPIAQFSSFRNAISPSISKFCAAFVHGFVFLSAAFLLLFIDLPLHQQMGVTLARDRERALHRFFGVALVRLHRPVTRERTALSISQFRLF